MFTTDESGAEVFRLREFDGIRQGDRLVRAVEDERADERLEFGNVVCGCEIDDERILFIRQFRLDDFSLCLGARGLQLPRDNGDGMSEGVELVERVAFVTENVPCIGFAAWIDNETAAIPGDNEGTDVVVVVVFGVVATFDGGAENASFFICIAEDIDARLREFRADGIGRVFRQGLTVLRLVIEGDQRHEGETEIQYLVWLEAFA